MRLAQPPPARSSPWFRRGADEIRYAELLHSHLRQSPKREIDFFINAHRFNILQASIGSDLSRPDRRVLNVGCGPFALEFYLAPQASIQGYDIDPRLASLHRELVATGLIPASRFDVADALAYLPQERYDLVVINDLLYAKAFDFFSLLPRFANTLTSRGRLYFDLLDARAGPIWRAFGKDDRYRRYHLPDVVAALDDHGLEIERTVPSLGIHGGLDSLARTVLWRTARIANNVIFVVSRKS